MNHSDKPEQETESVFEEAGKEGERAFRRGWWALFALGLLAIGVIGAVSGIQLRRTQLEKTIDFFGADAVAALQSSAVLRLRFDEGSPLAEKMESHDRTIDLAGVPGVGHLRHALLDQRHYDWDTVVEKKIEEQEKQSSDSWVAIELEGTPRGYDPIHETIFWLEMNSGAVGVVGGKGSVQLNSRVAGAVKEHVLMMSNVRLNR
ncbi:hypothetical protein FF011L_43230 [Roseimaritima multifibrata]|uniref:Uncharacterized protein n=1 Tax=Roseimaritima multifibrata TaxID=1930274 RepID=A0A517MKV8_9BACT|nr:hypothetical protein [Roseimaritima multifibrata]QDS95526.1 hypothetical protein FF011L_43230 [Roseimaritima multifibrata]